MKITIAGIGPGNLEDITPAAVEAIKQADVVVGYKYYFRFVEPLLKPGARCVDTGMRRECERAEQALQLALAGENVCVISSGDAGIYGMAPLVYEMASAMGADVEIETVPGISAFQKAASLLGAPIGHDLCLISLSDLMTPWEVIEKRIKSAVEGDFVTAVYNPKSAGRYWQLHRLQEIFLAGRSGDTPVGIVRQAGRDEQSVRVDTLAEFDPETVDMFTVLIVGNSQSYVSDGRFVTPRGYFRETANGRPGQQIMIESFRRIASELASEHPADKKWALLHAIHTTADFEMERLLWTSPFAVEKLHEMAAQGAIKTIVTDVRMAAAGIRRRALERLGIEVKCYLDDPRAEPREGETRTQAATRLAVEEHPEALYVFGNAPTALMELCGLMRRGAARPVGVVAAPVGFVHVEESKQMLKTFRDTPRLIVEGRKGGSNLAATLVNAILTFNDAEPGRDV